MRDAELYKSIIGGSRIEYIAGRIGRQRTGNVVLAVQEGPLSSNAWMNGLQVCFLDTKLLGAC